MVAGDGDHHEIGAPRPQGVVVQPAAHGEVGQEQPRVGARGADQLADQLLPARRAKVDRDRALALVEPGPEEAGAVVGHRPAVAVEAAADRVEADHVGPELGQRHPSQRRGDVGRALDHAHAGQDPGHAATATKRQSSTGSSSPSPPRWAWTSARRSTRLASASGQRSQRGHRELGAQDVALEHRAEVVAALPGDDRHQGGQRTRGVRGGDGDRVAAVGQPAPVGARAGVDVGARDVEGQARELGRRGDGVAALDLVAVSGGEL